MIVTSVLFGEPLQKIILFFFRLAWQSRLRLPYLLSVVLMALDIRVRVELHVNFM